MQVNYNVLSQKSSETDPLVQGLARKYLQLSEPQQNMFQRALLDHSPVSENDHSADYPVAWSDIAKVLGPIEWDWPGWLAKGFLAIIASESGVGKSGLLLRIAACYLLGQNWPDETPFLGDTGAVLWCETEAAQALNLERARRWGLPIERIYTPLPDPLDDVRLDSPQHRENILKFAARSDVRLTVVDSLRGAHHGDEDDSNMFEVVMWLAVLARDSGKPILLSHHLRKRSIVDSIEVSLDRVRGSSAIIQPARLVWAIDIPDIKEKDHKRLSVIKSNLGRFPDPIGVRIEEKGISFDRAPEVPKTETASDRACELLISLLQDGLKPVQEIEAAAKANGISMRTIYDAKAKLGILSNKEKGKAGSWSWSLPAKDAE